MKKIKMLFGLYRQLMSRFLPVIIIQAIAYAAIGVFFSVVQPILLQAVFSRLEAGQVSQTLRVCLQYAVILLFTFALNYFNNVILDVSCFRAEHYTVGKIFEIWHRRRGNFTNEGTVFQDVTTGARSMILAVSAIMQFMGAAGSLLFLLLFSAKAFWILPVILGVLFSVLLALNLYEFRMLRERENREQEALGAAENRVQRLFAEMNFLQKHDALAQAQEEYGKARQEAWNARLHKQNGHTTVELLSDMLIALSFLTLFLSIVFGADEKAVSMASLAMSVSLLQSIAGNVANLLATGKRVTAVLVPLERVSALLQDQTDHEKVQSDKETLIIDAKQPIFLKEGEHVAIIGCNGSGKTTLLNKIAGISYQSQGVPVRVYGKDAETLSYENRRQCISIAPKEEMLFDATAAENVLMNAAENEDADMNVLADRLGAGGFLDLYASQLSGGQAKRVNLMRACIHSARILLADEPTASLDETNAKQAMELLHDSARGKLLIVVTHDPKSLPDFDRIILMEHLEPIFSGSYQELKSSPEYERWLRNSQGA